jgi:hypothetical protein
MHPWRVADATRQTSHDVAYQMPAEVAAREALVDTHGLPRKKSALDKVDGNQLCEIGPHRQRMTVTSLAEAVPPAR